MITISFEMYLLRFSIFITLLGVLVGCNKSSKQLQARWIIMETRYNGEDILSNVSLRNISINLDEKGFVPTIFMPEFEDEGNDGKFKYEKRNGKEYLIIEGTKFFTDTFEIKRLDNNCCAISLEVKSKYIECIYNGELSPFMERRDCPNAIDVLKGKQKFGYKMR